MKVRVTESENWRRTLEIEAPAEDVEERLQAAYKKYSKSLTLPGFRKGKVPVNLVKKQFGPSIQGEVVQEMIGELYRKACESEGLEPVSTATIEDVTFEEGQPLVIKASVDVKPELQLEHYKGLQVTRSVFPVTEEHLETRLKAIQDQNATEQAVERAAEMGDIVVADIQELDESGQPVEDRKQEDRPVRLSPSEDDQNDFDKQLIGITVGEERQITITIEASHDHDHGDDHEDHNHEDHDHDHGDEDHNHEEHDHEEHDQDHEEREIRFQVTAKEICERTLPKLDDELAKDLGDFETLDALKERIQSELQEQSEGLSRQRLQENLLDTLIEKNEFDIPDSMVETFLDNAIESYKQEHAGHDHPIDEDAIREEGREGAVRSVKRFLLLETIAKTENIQVEEADIDKHLESLSERHQIEGPRLRQVLGRSGQLERIESDLQTEKTFDYLIEQAKIEDVEEVEE